MGRRRQGCRNRLEGTWTENAPPRRSAEVPPWRFGRILPRYPAVGLQHAPAPVPILSRPENLGHGPARYGPHEPRLGRQAAGAVHDIQSLIDHARAVARDHVARQIREPDVEVRLIDDDDFLDGGGLGRPRRLNRCGRRCREHLEPRTRLTETPGAGMAMISPRGSLNYSNVCFIPVPVRDRSWAACSSPW